MSLQPGYDDSPVTRRFAFDLRQLVRHYSQLSAAENDLARLTVWLASLETQCDGQIVVLDRARDAEDARQARQVETRAAAAAQAKLDAAAAAEAEAQQLEKRLAELRPAVPERPAAVTTFESRVR